EEHLADLDRAAVGREALHLRMRDREYLVWDDSLGLHETLRDDVHLLQRRRVVDVPVLHLEDHGEDVRAAEHAAEGVVDRDVRVALSPRVLVPEDADLARPGIEVEKLRNDPNARRLVCEEDRHDGDDDGHRETVAEQEAEVLLDPALRNHSPLACSPRRSSLAPSRRKTRPSAPTARPWPLGRRAIDRIQLAASWIGSGSTCQVVPPSPLLRTVPAFPTIQPRSPATMTS